MNKNLFNKKIFLIHGNQQLLIEETYKTLINTIIDVNENDLYVERFDVEEMIKTSGILENSIIEDFLISTITLPMFSQVKIILIDNFDLIKKTNKKNDPSSISRLYDSVLNLIENPPEYLWLILLSKATRETDFSRKLYQLLIQKWEVRKYISYDNSSPIKWVLERSKIKGLPITNNIAQLLIDVVGNDLSDLNHELEKLSISLSDKEINEDVIKKNIRGHKNFTIFKMTEALSNKELLSALEILETQIKITPNEHIRLFALIIMQFRRLISIKSMLKQNFKENDVLKNISLPQFLGKKLLTQYKNFKDEELQNIYIELSRLDLKIKFKSYLAPLLLKELFESICTGKFSKEF